MFRQPPPPPEFFDEDHLPSFILGVVVFGASAVGVAVTGGTLSSVLVLAVLSALCVAVALMDRRPAVSAPWRTDEPGDGDDGWGYRGRADDDDSPAPSSGPSGAADLFDWESFTEQFWAYVREREVSVPTGRRSRVRSLRGVPTRWKRRQRPAVSP
jgi:hypothetical protein